MPKRKARRPAEKRKGTRCAECGGGLKRVARTHFFTTGGEILACVANGEEFCLIRNMLSQICRDCGAEWIAEETFRAIERMLTRQPQPDKNVTVPVYEFRR